MKRFILEVLAAAALVAAAGAGGAPPRGPRPPPRGGGPRPPGGGARGGGGAPPGAPASPQRWKLDLTPGELQPALPGGAPASYFLPVTVANNTDHPIRPRLRFELRTNTGRTYGAYYDPRVQAFAEKALKKDRLGSVAGLRAEDLAAGAKAEAFANFGHIDPNADTLTVHVYGLWDPVVRTKAGNVVKETRVLVLTFDRTGDEYDRQHDPITLTSSKEEIEGEVVELYPAEKASVAK